MKQINKHSALRALGIGAVIAALSIGSVTAQVVTAFEFNEVAGTGLTGLINSGTGGGSFDADNAAAQTNGSGGLVIGGVDQLDATRRYAFVDGGDITSGVIQLDLTVTSWNFADVEFSPQFQFNVINDDPAAIGIAGIIFDVGDTDVFVNSISDTGTENPSSADVAFSKVLSSPILFRLTINLDALTYGLQYDDGTGFQTVGVTQALDGFDPADNILAREFQLVTRDDSTGSSFVVDSLTLTVVPEPSTMALFLLALVGGVVALRGRRQEA